MTRPIRVLALCACAVGAGVLATCGGDSSGSTGPSHAAVKLAFSGQPTTGVVGAAITPAIQVTVQDAQGATVTGSTASITLAITSGSGTSGAVVSGTLTQAAVNGVATFANLTVDKVGTGYTLTATATSLTSATSSAFAVNPGAAAKLAFTVQPSTVAAGAAVSPAVQVTVQDALGNTVTSATTSITLTITSGTGTPGAVLGGTRTVAAVSGVATFSNLTVDKAGTGYTLTATATATSLTSATSSAFAVSAAVPVASVAVTPGPDTLATGATLQLTATPKDASGNALAGRMVTWASSAPSLATVSATGLVTGVAPGTATITASAEGRTGGATLTVFDPCTRGRATFAIPGTFAGSLLSSDCMVNGTPRDSLQFVIPQQQTVLFSEHPLGTHDSYYWFCSGGICFGLDNVTAAYSFRVLYAPGTYSGFVTADSAAGRGSYAIDATVVPDDNSNCPDTFVIMPGITTQQQITSTDCLSPYDATGTARIDNFQVSMKAGTTYAFTMQATSQKLLEIWNPAGVQVARAPWGTSATLAFTPTSAGIYNVDIVGSTATLGPYTFSALPLGTVP